MHYARMDLLSYENVDEDVDRIFRAFCDTALIEFAISSRNSKKWTQTYWDQVRAFRRVHLTPYDRVDLTNETATTGGAADTIHSGGINEDDSEGPGDEASSHTQDFIYWFDVRADYWFRHPADQKVIDTLVPSEQLGSLYRAAKEVQKDFHNAQEVAGIHEWRAGDGQSNALLVVPAIRTPSAYPEEG